MLADTFRAARAGWGGNGPGSLPEKVATISAGLREIVERHRISSVLDYGCGEVGWLLSALPGGVAYLGVDVVPDVIEQNYQRHLTRVDTNFLLLRSFADQLPRMELVFVRDCLAHLSTRDVIAALAQINSSGATWLFATTTPGAQGCNTEIETGGFRPLNLCALPFSFPAPVGLVHEWHDDKAMGLWRVGPDTTPRGWVIQ